MDRKDHHIAARREPGLLPPDTVSVETMLDFAQLPPANSPSRRELRTRRRATWALDGHKATEGCDIVFLDPDNGLIPKSQQPYGDGGPQYATLHEINELTGRGQSVILYLHADHLSVAPQPVERHLATLATSTSASGFAMTWHPWSKPYIGDGPDVIHQLNDALPDGWSATLLAVDGSVTGGVVDQLGHLLDSATHLVLSSRGNDALTHQDFLLGSARSTAEALLTLSEMARDFRALYRSLLSDIGSLELPTAVCTIYDPSWDDADQVAVASTALNGFNDVIIREAALP